MNDGYLIFYQRRNGEIFERFRTTLPDNRIGEYSSMGWLIKDIKYVFDGKVYNTEKEEKAAIHKKYRGRNIKNFAKDLITTHLWQVFFVVYTSSLTFIYFKKM